MKASQSLDLLVVVDETDRIKMYSKLIISSIGSVFPTPKVQQISFWNMDIAKKRYKLCKKLLFIIDEEISSEPFMKIQEWMENINGIKCDPEKIFVVAIKLNEWQSVTDSEECSSNHTDTWVSFANRVVVVKNIDKLDAWWPSVIKFVFKTNEDSSCRIPLLLTPDKNCTSTTSLAFVDEVNSCLMQFYVADITTAKIYVTNDPSSIKPKHTWNKGFVLVESDFAADKITAKEQNVYETTEKLKAILHILIEFEAVQARRMSECKIPCSIQCSIPCSIPYNTSGIAVTLQSWTLNILRLLLSFLVVLFNVPVTCLLIALILCLFIGCIYIPLVFDDLSKKVRKLFSQRFSLFYHAFP